MVSPQWKVAIIITNHRGSCYWRFVSLSWLVEVLCEGYVTQSRKPELQVMNQSISLILQARTLRPQEAKRLRQSHTGRLEGLSRIPRPWACCDFHQPSLGLFRQTEPTGMSEQGLWHCSYHLQTLGKSKGGLHILQEEKNIPWDPEKTLYLFGPQF